VFVTANDKNGGKDKKNREGIKEIDLK